MLNLKPIGYVRSGRKTKFDVPHQPLGNEEEVNTIELLPRQQFEQALQDLSGFDRVWLIWWFHRNTEWKPQVRPPRGKNRKRGVFATRSPHRPNPLGITPVKLIKVEKRFLTVGELDLIDGTPILDIKPYIPSIDAFPGSRAGWVDELEVQVNELPEYSVEIEEPAEKQARWLKEKWQIDFLTRAMELLKADPTPHRTRRIRKHAEGMRISCGAWRLYYRIEGSKVIVQRMGPGYPEENLRDPRMTRITHREAQLAFLEVWGGHARFALGGP